MSAIQALCLGSPRGEGRSPVERNILKKKNSIPFEQVPVLIAARVARVAQFAVLAPTLRPAYLVQLPETQFLIPSPEKTTLIFAFRAGFMGSGWGKLSVKKCLDLMPFGGLWARCSSPLF